MKHVTDVRMVAVVTNRDSIGIINHIFDCLTAGCPEASQLIVVITLQDVR